MNTIAEKTERKSLVEGKKFIIAIFGTFLYAIGMNWFVVPLNLYSGGVMGVCQIIRTVLVTYLHMPVVNVDVAGIIYYIINIPIFILGYKCMGRLFMLKTVVCVTTMSIFLTIVPVISILETDVLASCLIGGIISGVGCGLNLKMSSSAGGMDILGIYMVKKKGNYSVGKANIIVNIFVYGICLFMFDIPIVIYSIIYSVIYSIAIDRIHSQNINVEVIVISKKANDEMKNQIMTELERGITQWKAKGAYTMDDSEVLYILLSKYEVAQLKSIIRQYDKDAYIVVKEGTDVDGNYLKKL